MTICSNALLSLGDDPIASFDDATPRARLAASLYPSCRDYLLRSHPWNFATKRVILAADTSPPAFGYANRFRQPDDWLRTMQVGQYAEDRIDYLHESGYFLTDESVFYLRYVWRNDQEATWDALAIRAMEAVMRQVFTYPVTASTSLEQLTTQVLEPFLKLARTVDGQDNPPDTFGDFPLLASRYGG